MPDEAAWLNRPTTPDEKQEGLEKLKESVIRILGLDGVRDALTPSTEVSENRIRGWEGADKRHDMSLPPEVRNARENELWDHYSVGADLGPVAGPPLAHAQEMVGRPLLARYPDLANKLLPSVFNFKTESNDRPGAIDPYTVPTARESAENLGATLHGTLDAYPRLQGMYEDVSTAVSPLALKLLAAYEGRSK